MVSIGYYSVPEGIQIWFLNLSGRRHNGDPVRVTATFDGTRYPASAFYANYGLKVSAVRAGLFGTRGAVSRKK